MKIDKNMLNCLAKIARGEVYKYKGYHPKRGGYETAYGGAVMAKKAEASNNAKTEAESKLYEAILASVDKKISSEVSADCPATEFKRSCSTCQWSPEWPVQVGGPRPCDSCQEHSEWAEVDLPVFEPAPKPEPEMP